MSNELNPFGAAPGREGGSLQNVTAAMATTRQAQEVQAMVIMAKRFPRDQRASMDRILQACTRVSLAEAAIYSFPRGGSEVSGPSIRLAECIAQEWGNIDFGYAELDQRPGESQVMAYAWDLETNTRQSKIFSVPHVRHTQKGDYPLTDPRDIYELVANQAARRIRSCILSVIPGDVIESAVKQCDVTLKAGNGTSLDERITNMVLKFQELNITPDMLRGFIGKNVEAFTANDLARLAKIYRSIKDGVVGVAYFTEKMQNSAAPEQEAPAAPAQIPEGVPAQPVPVPAEPAPAEQQMGLDDL